MSQRRSSRGIGGDTDARRLQLSPSECVRDRTAWHASSSLIYSSFLHREELLSAFHACFCFQAKDGEGVVCHIPLEVWQWRHWGPFRSGVTHLFWKEGWGSHKVERTLAGVIPNTQLIQRTLHTLKCALAPNVCLIIRALCVHLFFPDNKSFNNASHWGNKQQVISTFLICFVNSNWGEKQFQLFSVLTYREIGQHLSTYYLNILLLLLLF